LPLTASSPRRRGSILLRRSAKEWIPAFAGMTPGCCCCCAYRELVWTTGTSPLVTTRRGSLISVFRQCRSCPGNPLLGRREHTPTQPSQQAGEEQIEPAALLEHPPARPSPARGGG